MASLGPIRWLGVAAAALLLLAGASGPANALSFTIPDGARILDIDTANSATASGYDGTTETFSIFSDIRTIRLDTAPPIEFAEGEVELSVQMTLQGTILNVGPVLLGDYTGDAADFTIRDIAGGNEVIFAASFDDPAPLQMTVQNYPFSLGIIAATLGGGDYTKIDMVNPFDDAMSPTGSLGIQLQALLVGGLPATSVNILDNPGVGAPPGGFQDFTFNPVSDLTPIPEPATGLLFAAAIVALAAASRRLR